MVNVSWVSLEILNELAVVGLRSIISVMKMSLALWFVDMFRFFPTRRNNLDTTCCSGKNCVTLFMPKVPDSVQRLPLVGFSLFLRHDYSRSKKTYKNKKLSIFLFNLNKLAIQRETRSSISFLHSTSFWTALSTLDTSKRYINRFSSNELFCAARVVRVEWRCGRNGS